MDIVENEKGDGVIKCFSCFWGNLDFHVLRVPFPRIRLPING